jgi:outer membrane protein assembly factor BamB
MIRENAPRAPLLLFADNVTALDRQTGRQLWTYALGGDAVRRFAIEGERLFCFDGGANLHCLRLSDGQLLGRVKIATITTAENMMIDGERLFVVGDSRVVCLTLEGAILWDEKVPRNQRHTLTGMAVPGVGAIQPDFSRG